jgi:hypothetical protein
MTPNPKVRTINLDPCPRVRCPDVHRNGSAGRKQLRNPPTSNMRDSIRTNIHKDFDENIESTTPRYDSVMHQLSHKRDSLNGWVCVIFFARVVVSECRHIIAGPTYFRDDIFPGPHDIRWFSAHGFCRCFSIFG